MGPSSDHVCPLCLGLDCRYLHRSEDSHGLREFYECLTCDLAFVPPRFHLPQMIEYDRYRLHNNDPDDEGYRRFLSRLWDVLKPRLPESSRGLDFGCGPGPALAQMMREDGFDVRLYDPFFFPDRCVLELKYDFVTCTETVEHLRSPSMTFALLDGLVIPGGRIGVMTGMLDDRSDFASWYYQRDPTHIAFYSKRTMLWIGEMNAWVTEFPAPNVTIFFKPTGPCT